MRKLDDSGLIGIAIVLIIIVIALMLLGTMMDMMLYVGIFVGLIFLMYVFVKYVSMPYKVYGIIASLLIMLCIYLLAFVWDVI